MLNEYPGSVSDTDNFAFEAFRTNTKIGEYFWWELSHSSSPSPQPPYVFEVISPVNDSMAWESPDQSYTVWKNGADEFYYMTTEANGGNGGADAYWKADTINTPYTNFVAQGVSSGDVDLTFSPGGAATVSE